MENASRFPQPGPYCYEQGGSKNLVVALPAGRHPGVPFQPAAKVPFLLAITSLTSESSPLFRGQGGVGPEERVMLTP